MTEAVPDVAEAPARRDLWFHTEFRKLWLAQIVSAFGSRITRDGLPALAVLVMAATPAEVALLNTMSTLPTVLLGLVAGVWVDRLRRRPIMIWADLGRALVLLTIPAAYLAEALTFAQLYVVAGLAAVLTLFFQLADNAFLPTLIGRDRLMEGNGKLAASESVAEIGGPSLAGILIQILTAPVAILFDALSFLVSALFLGAIRTKEQRPQAVDGHVPNLWREMKEGLGLVARHPVLRPLVGASATGALFGGFFMALYMFYALDTLALPPAWVGIIIGTGGVGALLGSLLANRLGLRFGVGRTLIASRLLGGAAQFFIPLAYGVDPWVAAGFLIAAQIFGDMFYVVFFVGEASLRQASIPDRVLGRSEAAVRTAVGLLAVVGALLGGWIGTVWGATEAFWIAAAGQLLPVLWLLSPAVRAVRTLPKEPVAG